MTHLCQIDERTIKEIPILATCGALSHVSDFAEYRDDLPMIQWGDRVVDKLGSLAIEGGFFHKACWIDKLGGFKYNSLNYLNESGELNKLLEDYTPPFDIIDEVVKSRISSKYVQEKIDVEWNKVVLIQQVPIDHSIWYQCARDDTSPYQAMSEAYEKYIEWYKNQCEIYGSDLFIKTSPAEDFTRISEMGDVFVKYADMYGCKIGQADISVIDTASLVIMYNSTVAVDCMLRGTDYRCDGDGNIPNISKDLRKNFVHFLMWKYCLPKEMDSALWERVIRMYLESSDLFPLTESLSWGAWFRRSNAGM